MAHVSHAPDTTFVIAEPDFFFTKPDGDTQTHFVDRQQAFISAYAPWDELADQVPEAERAEFRRDLDKWVESVKTDQNAAWPEDAHTWAPGPEDDHQPRDAEQIDWGERVTWFFQRPGKPPVTAFRPDRISDNLYDLQALFTAASRLGRKVYGWDRVCLFVSGNEDKGPHEVCWQGSVCSEDGARTRGADEHLASSCKR